MKTNFGRICLATQNILNPAAVKLSVRIEHLGVLVSRRFESAETKRLQQNLKVTFRSFFSPGWNCTRGSLADQDEQAGLSCRSLMRTERNYVNIKYFVNAENCRQLQWGVRVRYMFDEMI